MQGAYLSLLYSTNSKPLEYWSKQKSRTGSIRRVIDKDLNKRVSHLFIFILSSNSNLQFIYVYKLKGLGNTRCRGSK